MAVSDINTLEFWNLINCIVLFISQLPDIVQKFFCTPGRPTNRMCVTREIKKNKSGAFLGHPVASCILLIEQTIFAFYTNKIRLETAKYGQYINIIPPHDISGRLAGG